MSARTVSLLLALPDDSLLAQFRDSLSREGYRVETARTAIECVVKAQRIRPDFLILDQDIALGGIDGVLTILHDHEDMHAPPVILITLERPIDLPTDCLIPPVVRWVQKPFALPVLQEAIGALECLL